MKGALDYTRSLEEELAFAAASAVVQMSIALAKLFDKTGTLDAALLDKIGLTERQIEQLLDLRTDTSVRTLARIARAVGYQVKIVFWKIK